MEKPIKIQNYYDYHYYDLFVKQVIFCSCSTLQVRPVPKNKLELVQQFLRY